MRQKLVALDPRNAPYQFALAQDAAAGRQYTTAATALKAYLDLEPNLDAGHPPAARADAEGRFSPSGRRRQLRSLPVTAYSTTGYG